MRVPTSWQAVSAAFALSGRGVWPGWSTRVFLFLGSPSELVSSGVEDSAASAVTDAFCRYTVRAFQVLRGNSSSAAEK